MCWRSSPDRERPMVRLKRSTAGLNICAGLLWGSVTSPTTSPGVCSSPVASDRFYTLNYDEPHIAAAVSHPSELESQPAIVPLAAGLSAGAPGTDDCFGPAPVIPAVNTLRAGIRSGCPPEVFG